jgi:hypothetical protein
LAAEQARTGVDSQVFFNRSGLVWEGRIDGTTVKLVSYSEDGAIRALLSWYRGIPDEGVGKFTPWELPPPLNPLPTNERPAVT